MRYRLAAEALVGVMAACAVLAIGSSEGSRTLPPALIWMEDGTTDPGATPRYFVSDWTGRRVASLSIPGRQVQPSPDGTRALVDGSEMIDASGSGLGTVDIPGLPTYIITWADDNRHLCALGVPQRVEPGRPASVWLVALGVTPRKIIDVTGEGADRVTLTCSMVRNRGGVISAGPFLSPTAGPYEVTKLLQVVNLTTAQVVYTRDYAADLPSTLFWAGISADGRYLAEENLLQGMTAITELGTGRTVARFVGAHVISFSPDDRTVALHVVGKELDETRVVDLATGRITWKGQGSLGVLFRPGSSDMVVRLDDPRGDYDLLLVPATGSPHVIAQQVIVSW